MRLMQWKEETTKLSTSFLKIESGAKKYEIQNQNKNKLLELSNEF